jgi:KipI family sensor histidine kinase inhibitor
VSAPTIHQLGQSALLVSFGEEISERTNVLVHSLAATLREKSISGIVDLVPAFSSLLIRFDPTLLDEVILRSGIVDAIAAIGEATVPEARTHLVPICYGGDYGPDLDALAGERGLTVREVVDLHCEPEYGVYFLGFMPGFAYMGTVPAEIAAPRLPSPRVRVPAGSVGIASSQTGIYPFSSPGGWRLIGRTNLPLWDPYRNPPAFFAAGDKVRFVPTGTLDESEPTTLSIAKPERPVFQVLEGGPMTTIQDAGRPGYGAVGLCQGGWSDSGAAMPANALVGNDAGAAVLEMIWGGPALKALRTTTIALQGADFGCTVDGRRVPVGLSWLVRAGSIVRFAQQQPGPGGALAYLAVTGGFEVSRLLGSAATYLPAAFGGIAGRSIRAEDVLGCGVEFAPPAALAGRQTLSNRPVPPASNMRLHFIPYEGPGSAGKEAIAALAATEWAVMPENDRVGTRLRSVDGQVSAPAGSGEVISFGVVRGAIQLPPNGNPVLLGPDHQTTGGYPVIGVLSEVDWAIAAQLSPGSTVRFSAISVAEARTARERAKAELGRDVAGLRK